ncbi:MAG: S9 family peptidase [Gammaproteobacteria bacterium]|nr:S9 family peptidase [Gammaproteobacteria bacterium]
MRAPALLAPFLMLPALTLPASAEPPPLEVLFADSDYREVTISPNGKYYAVITPVDGRDTLVTLKSDKSAVVGQFGFRDTNESVSTYQWLKDEHLLIHPATVYGWRDEPSWYGELFSARADGKDFRAIYGYRAGEMQTGSRIKKAEPTRGWGELVSDLPSDPELILVASYPWVEQGGSRPTIQQINLKDAVSKRVMGAPAEDAQFLASPRGEVRFATAWSKDEVERVFEYLPGTEWREVASNSLRGGSAMEPLGLSADGRTAYFLSDSGAAVRGLFSLELGTRIQTLIYRDAKDDIDAVELDPWTGEPLWLTLRPDNRLHVIKPDHPLSKLVTSLTKAFPDDDVVMTSVTRDYKRAIFHTSSDRDPGVWYSVNPETREARLELEANSRVNPDALVPVEPVAIRARDGLMLQGFYTVARRESAPKPPLVVLVHGGPHSRDDWEFNPEVQMLATRGYAVLQVNFRGSTGFGRQFEVAGRGQWGRAMQDDVTDATRWAIQEGRADPERICIMGGSYGGYASLMGVIREPDLYRCAVDLFGVTDLAELFAGGDIPDRLWGRAYLKDTIGPDRKEWDARSPARLADRIKVPVLIIAGGQDKRVPIVHAELMEKALKRAGKPVETLYYPSEGHGFALLEHRVEAYRKVLDFLARNIGGGA